MFQINTIQEKGWVKYELINTNNNTTVGIIPQCGAMLHEFSITKSNKQINIVEQYESFDDFNANAESKGFKSSKLSPFVCRMKNGEYNFENKNYKTAGFYLPPHAIHGLIYKQPFNVTNTASNKNEASIELLFEYRANDIGYPFNYDCVVAYLLKNDNSLFITTKIINQSSCNIPIADGWHPYFSFGKNINDAEIYFNSAKMIEFDETLIPTGALLDYNNFNNLKKLGDSFFDNCFLLKVANNTEPVCILKDAETNLQLAITPIANYTYLQIYTPPHRKSIAIENLSATPDAFNNGMGLRILKPDEEVDFVVKYEIAML